MTDAAVVELHPKTPAQKDLASVNSQLDDVLKQAVADKYRADVSEVAIKYLLVSSISTFGSLAIALAAFRPNTSEPFRAELDQLYNYSVAVMNRIREAKGLLPVKAPELP